MTEVLRRKARHMTANARRVLDVIEKAMQPRKIDVGDRVRFNDYSGRVLSVEGDMAVIVEPSNRAFGRAVKWTLNIDALTRAESDPC